MPTLADLLRMGKQYMTDARPGGLLSPEISPGMPTDVAKGLLGFTPGIGDAISGYDAVQSARQGDYLGALLNGAGVLPFVPAMGGIVTNNSLKDVLSKINAKYGTDIGGHLWPMMTPAEQAKGVYIGRVQVPKENRGQGIGTKAMQELLDYTDSEGAKTFLTPSLGLGATSINRLEDFYKNLGFKRNTGRHADYEINDSFIRDPKIKKD